LSQISELGLHFETVHRTLSFELKPATDWHLTISSVNSTVSLEAAEFLDDEALSQRF
jgi:hypothetical protein